MNHFPSSALRASSPQGEGFPLFYETEDSATPGKPSVQNDLGGDVRVKKESGSLKYAAKTYTLRSALV